jgi:energy-coupling factor transporter ATP-binding protein EcfA2
MATKVNTNLAGDFSICQNSGCGKSFDITDKSGIYSSTSNVEGWGYPNPLISNVETCTLTMITPSGDSFTFNLYENSVFPNTSDSSKRITHTEDLEDGVYEFVYRISGTKISNAEILWEVTNRKYILFSCNTECCRDKLFSEVVLDCSNCGSEKLEMVSKITTYIEGAKYAACCGNVERAKKLLSQAKFLCSSQNCNSCS